MTDTETIKKIEEYIFKKNFDVEFVGCHEKKISFFYNSNNLDYIINILIEKKNNQSVVKYYSNRDIPNIKRLKTSISSKNYLRSIYKNLNYIKHELNIISTLEKEICDNNKKYCTELESHYKRIHNYIRIDAIFTIDDIVVIAIIGYDDNKTTNYNITYTKNKYYINSIEEKYTPNIIINVDI